MNSLRQIITDYKAQKRAIPAFNIDSFEIYQAVETAVASTGLPCIVQLSTGEDTFIQGERLLILVKKAQIEGLPIYLNMDHGKDMDRLEHLAKLGFDMIHLDGSNLDFHANLEITKQFVAKIRNTAPNTLIEVEFNKINIASSSISPESLTKTDQAIEFMSQTGADLLAVSIGNLHGVSANFPEIIDLGLLGRIVSTVPDKYFTLHGGSGISWDQVDKAINLGISKININTELRQKFKEILSKSLASTGSDKIYEYMELVNYELQQIMEIKLKQYARVS